jgi:hypothetical protein
MDAENRIFILDNDNGRIAVYSADGQFLRGIGRAGPGPGEFEGSPNVLDGLALDGDFLVAFEGPTRRVQVFRTDGTYVSSFAKRLGLSSIAIAGERIYTSTAGQTGTDARIEVFSLSGDLVKEFGEGGVGEAETAREARRINRSLIAVAPTSGEVGRVYQYTPILRIYGRDGSLESETAVELRDPPQSQGDPPGVSLSERTLRALVARDIEYVVATDLWVVLLAGGVIRAYAGEGLEVAGEVSLLKPEGHVDAEDSMAAAALDIGVSPAGDMVCTTVAVEHEVWCYELQWE